jgi:hypothetical protein
MTKKVTLKDFYRHARTGRFVTEEYHEDRPKTTEHERRPIPSPAPEHKPRKGK